MHNLSSAAEADAEPTQASITMREKCLMDVQYNVMLDLGYIIYSIVITCVLAVSTEKQYYI